MLNIWEPGHTDLPSVSMFLAGGVAFVVAVAVTRLKRGGPKAGERRSMTSMIGVLIQVIAISLASGPVVVVDPFDPLRFLVVAVAMTATPALFWWAAQTMGRNWAIIARTRADHELVTGGPFAYVRHPIYVAMALFMTGLAVSTGHSGSLLLAVPLFAIGTLVRTSEEERLLRTHFGAAYENYARRVKRFIPGVI